MRVAKLVVPPSAVAAGYAVMTGDFSTDDVAGAVQSANNDIGMDPGEHTGEEFARMVARKLIDKAVAAEIVTPLADGTWRGPEPE